MSSTVSEIVLRNLDQNQLYCVRVRGQTAEGRTGGFGDSVYAATNTEGTGISLVSLL